ncbi:MAG TPA: AAA family ATPase [Calditrichaeota bacterium]|nr:AAA family ATPase [Calditrichota bacterium]
MDTNLAEKISTPAAVWKGVQDILKNNLNLRSYNTWFAPTEAIAMDDHSIEISVPNRFFCEWIDNHYSKIVQNALTQILGYTVKIKYSVKNNPIPGTPYQATDWQKATPEENSGASLPQQVIESPYYTRINERYIFDNFIVGDSNHFAYAAARAIADSPGRTNYNPLIVYGGTGLGKTHLIQAIGNHAMKKYPGLKVFYTSSDTFTSHFINSIQSNKVAEFSAFYRSCDILLLDDIHFFSNKGKTQEEFFHTFNDLHQHLKYLNSFLLLPLGDQSSQSPKVHQSQH